MDEWIDFEIEWSRMLREGERRSVARTQMTQRGAAFIDAARDMAAKMPSDDNQQHRKQS